jgi:hypothetical protein
MGAPLLPAQVEVIERVWTQTANAAEAARQAGCSEASARRYIIRARLKDSDGLYADACARGVRLAAQTVAKARRKIDAALDNASDVKDLTALAAQAHDNLRVRATVQMNHAKLSGVIVEKHDVTSGGSPLTIFAPAEREP